MANNAKTADPAAPTAQPAPAAMLTTSAQQAMTMAQTRFEDVAAKSREAMEMGLKAVDVAAATDRVPRSGVGSGGSETDRTRAHQ